MVEKNKDDEGVGLSVADVVGIVKELVIILYGYIGWNGIRG